MLLVMRCVASSLHPLALVLFASVGASIMTNVVVPNSYKAVVSSSSDIPQRDIGNRKGLYVTYLALVVLWQEFPALSDGFWPFLQASPGVWGRTWTCKNAQRNGPHTHCFGIRSIVFGYGTYQVYEEYMYGFY